VTRLCDNLIEHAMSKADDPLDTTAADARDIALDRRRKALKVCASDPRASFENVWHTLILLELDPIERLNRSLIRGRAAAIQR
jgi:hypothetical protein